MASKKSTIRGLGYEPAGAKMDNDEKPTGIYTRLPKKYPGEYCIVIWKRKTFVPK